MVLSQWLFCSLQNIVKYLELIEMVYQIKREHNSINQIRLRIIGNVLGQKYSIYFQKTVSTR